MATTKFYWHLHHDVLLEETSNIQKRIDYIKKYKPEKEIPLRLKLMTPVLHPEKLPAQLRKVREDYNKAREDYSKAQEDYIKAQEDYSKAQEDYNKASEVRSKAWEDCQNASEIYYNVLKDYYKIQEDYYKAQETSAPEIEKLHREEHPDCPWNGETIFSKVD